MTRTPNFLVIGAQKCGTSWIHHHLRAHPEIFLPPDKDQGHFFFRSTRGTSSARRYRMQFAAATPQQIAIGETSAAYFWTRTGSSWDLKPEDAEADVAQRIKSDLGPEARFILTLRDPVERAVSAYFHHQAFGDLDPDTALMDAASFVGVVDMGFYARHLLNWLTHYRRDQILILSLDRDISASPRQALRRAFEFLGVDPDHAPKRVGCCVFPGRGRCWRDGAVWACDRDGQQRIAVDAATVTELRAIFRPDADRLADILGHDFVAAWPTMRV